MKIYKSLGHWKPLTYMWIGCTWCSGAFLKLQWIFYFFIQAQLIILSVLKSIWNENDWLDACYSRMWPKNVICYFVFNFNLLNNQGKLVQEVVAFLFFVLCIIDWFEHPTKLAMVGFVFESLSNKHNCASFVRNLVCLLISQQGSLYLVILVVNKSIPWPF